MLFRDIVSFFYDEQEWENLTRFGKKKSGTTLWPKRKERKRETCHMEGCQSKCNWPPWRHAKNPLHCWQKFIQHANSPTAPQDRKTSCSSDLVYIFKLIRHIWNIIFSSEGVSKLLTLWITWPQWQNPTVPHSTSYMNRSCMICHHVMVDDKRRCSSPPPRIWWLVVGRPDTDSSTEYEVNTSGLTPGLLGSKRIESEARNIM